MSDRLAEARARLDRLDETLLELLAEREAVVSALAAWKAAEGLPFRDPAREAETLRRLRALAVARGLDPDAVERVFRDIVGHRFAPPGPELC